MGQRKRAPNTTQPSHPHPSKSTDNKKHVDLEKRDDKGRFDRHVSKHHRESGLLELGRLQKKADKKKRDK